jgi:peptidoglycan/LPS O-acetylase OafA/YrhL
MSRVAPISSIRFVLACWVVLSHFGPGALRSDAKGIASLAEGLLRNAFDGIAAVIVFFVISGFCIHYPHRREREVASYRAFYLRRYLRTLIPMACAILLAVPLDLPIVRTILWSLMAEEIYYLIYPLLLVLRNRIGWPRVMLSAWLCSAAVIWLRPNHYEYFGYGWQLTWVVGLPCWLLGCRLAESVERPRRNKISTLRIWSWRAGIWACSSTIVFLTFHTPIHAACYLNAFACVAALWLDREIQYYREKPATKGLEKLGETSYSIYLMHTHGPALIHSLFGIAWSASFLPWLASVGASAAVSIVFYILVERPSHRIARGLLRPAVAHRAASTAAA